VSVALPYSVSASRLNKPTETEVAFSD
jgi:hypothetical protein